MREVLFNKIATFELRRMEDGEWRMENGFSCNRSRILSSQAPYYDESSLLRLCFCGVGMDNVLHKIL